MFSVTKKVAQTPQEDVVGSWVFFFGGTIPWTDSVGWAGVCQQTHKELNVPIGMIHTSWGGTPAEA
ncbi:MAG: hypothetical protein R2688_00855 [Fimbriimonadaceae bacterium]